MTTRFGIDVLLQSPDMLTTLASSRAAVVGNPASICLDGRHALDALMGAGCRIVRAFGPQHGMRGDKQDNMVESDDYRDPARGIPVTSLYGVHRRPTQDMLSDLDVVLFDLQDIGCRIYTYLTTLRYFMESCAVAGTRLVVLDRPNPAGRPIDGLRLEPGHESFVGVDTLPTRYGLTIGELARWLLDRHKLDVDLTIVPMQDYAIDDGPGFGWPLHERPWVNPSPNAASLNMARCFAGTVMLEGTQLSEGRGTTTPLEVMGAPDFPAGAVLAHLRDRCPRWLEGIYIRHCFFEPTFHKHVGALCEGLQFHTDTSTYAHHRFMPFRLVAGLLKSLRTLRADYPIWRHHEYEYEPGRIPIDVITGGHYLREWVDDPQADFADLDDRIEREIAGWHEERAPYEVYPA